MANHPISRCGAAGIRALPWTSAALVVAFAWFLGRMPTDALPQRVSGGDALSVAFGGAKAAIGQAMYRKADSYFHGGIDGDCPHCGPAPASRAPDSRAPDPWRWINDRIRAPGVHTHLDGERAVELMPWLWASVRANPRDAEVWTSAMYVAERMLKDDALVRRILDEAKAKNPESAEIAFAEGKFLYKQGAGDVSAAKAAFERAKALLGDDDSEQARQIRRMTDGYLTHIGR